MNSRFLSEVSSDDLATMVGEDVVADNRLVWGCHGIEVTSSDGRAELQQCFLVPIRVAWIGVESLACGYLYGRTREFCSQTTHLDM